MIICVPLSILFAVWECSVQVIFILWVCFLLLKFYKLCKCDVRLHGGVAKSIEVQPQNRNYVIVKEEWNYFLRTIIPWVLCSERILWSTVYLYLHHRIYPPQNSRIEAPMKMVVDYTSQSRSSSLIRHCTCSYIKLLRNAVVIWLWSEIGLSLALWLSFLH